MKPKLCVNRTCKKVMYVPNYKLHMMLQFPTCTNWKKK